MFGWRRLGRVGRRRRKRKSHDKYGDERQKRKTTVRHVSLVNAAAQIFLQVHSRTGRRTQHKGRLVAHTKAGFARMTRQLSENFRARMRAVLVPILRARAPENLPEPTPAR